MEPILSWEGVKKLSYGIIIGKNTNLAVFEIRKIRPRCRRPRSVRKVTHLLTFDGLEVPCREIRPKIGSSSHSLILFSIELP